MGKQGTISNSLTFVGIKENLNSVRHFVEEAIATAHIVQSVRDLIVLSIDEVCANLINHAFSDDTSNEITVHIIVTDTTITIEVLDTATSFDLSTVPVADVADRVRLRQRGGLGILIVRRVMDSVDYIPKGNGHIYNKLVLTKRIVA